MQRSNTPIILNHAAEAIVATPHAEHVAEKLHVKTRACSLSTRIIDAERLLVFEDAWAILIPTREGLRIRVEARELDMFYGIRAILQIAISDVATMSNEHVEWHPSGITPFGPAGGQGEHGQSSLLGR